MGLMLRYFEAHRNVPTSKITEVTKCKKQTVKNLAKGKVFIYPVINNAEQKLLLK